MIIAIAVVLLNSLLATHAGESSPLKSHPDSKTWADLFAADLSNAVFPAGVWSWQDGELTPKDKDEAIWSKKEYENFILDLEFNLDPAANSGVFVYNTDMQNWIPNTLRYSSWMTPRRNGPTSRRTGNAAASSATRCPARPRPRKPGSGTG